MATIAAGTSSTLYIPIAQSLTITPGTSGKASLNGRNQDGSAITPQEIYSATTIALRAGATITVEAINVDATCTDVADSLSSVSGGGVSPPTNQPTWMFAPTLQAVATGGAPSLLNTALDSGDTRGVMTTHFWSMSGGTAGQSLVGVFDAAPHVADGYEVAVEFFQPFGSDTTKKQVWKVIATPMTDGVANPVASGLLGSPRVRYSKADFTFNRDVIEPLIRLDPAQPVNIRLTRDNADAKDDFTGSVGVVGVSVKGVKLPAPSTVQVADAYNAWPFLASAGGRLICVYSKGVVHNYPDLTRKVVCKYSTDNGVTWSAESTVVDTPSFDDTAVGIGKDSSGNLLLWVRKCAVSGTYAQVLFRSTDYGTSWSQISAPAFATNTIQCGGIFSVPTVGLMSLYHAGAYGGGLHAWGVVKSADDGLTWTQTQIETDLTDTTWPTEISGIYTTAGKILALGRTELSSSTVSTSRAMVQLESSDYGVTWTRTSTNITDVVQSTPTLLSDGANLHCYYYHRGWGILKRRKTTIAAVQGVPDAWPTSSALAIGSKIISDAGNASACLHDGRHYVAYYDGVEPLDGIYLTSVTP